MKSTMPVVACINDLSGYGKCSLTIALPVISAMGMQCCPLPTAILSNHTGYESFLFHDFTPFMREYYQEWEKLDLRFSAVYSGFLGSQEQIDIVREICRKQPGDTLIFIDPVMADNGKIYSTYTQDMCEKLRDLAALSHVVTPNVTEACILAGIPYQGEALSDEAALQICQKIAGLGAEHVVVTGVKRDGQHVENLAYRKADGFYASIQEEMTQQQYAGTGDVFASALCGYMLQKLPFEAAVRSAASFVAKAAHYTAQFDTDPKDGVLFEHFLKEL